MKIEVLTLCTCEIFTRVADGDGDLAEVHRGVIDGHRRSINIVIQTLVTIVHVGSRFSCNAFTVGSVEEIQRKRYKYNVNRGGTEKYLHKERAGIRQTRCRVNPR
jgi:hypothetical protein